MKKTLDKIKLYGTVNGEGGAIVWGFFKSIFSAKYDLSQSRYKHLAQNQI